MLAAIVGASALRAIAAIVLRLDVPVAGTPVPPFLVLPIVPAALREGSGGKREGDREESKELCHTNSAWLTNSPM